MLAAPVATFFAFAGKPPDSISAAVNEAVALRQPAGAGQAGGSTAIASAYWPAAGVVVWLCGIVVLSVRLAGGWIVARRMARRSVQPAAAHIQAVASDLAERLGACGLAVETRLADAAPAEPSSMRRRGSQGLWS